ncbi:chemotaxis protein [Trinickia dabaoshanensis]|uniref:Chemotaxis protein n=1 Tax=Trinickia dabaoshanensis TaxID=564714 RepID=A0A2N7VE66_9BURK|nr:methyl-accepting chemotaxis protein [Trinickia dabaoshanensis]PMS15451.1 chemotaxis protein [Trinickia dabaoshanensis]
MNLANLPIARKLYLSFAAVIATFVVLGAVFFSLFSSVAVANKWDAHTYQVINETRALTESLVNMETGLRGFAIVGEETMLDPYLQGATAFRQHLAGAESLTRDNAQQQERLRRLENQEANWVSTFAENLLAQRKSVSSGNLTMDAFISSFKEHTGKADMDAMRATIGEIQSSEAALLAVRAAEVTSLQTKTQIALIAGTSIGAALALFLATWITRLVAPPLHEAVELAEAIAEGDLTRTITSATRDEIGTLLRALSNMQDKLISVVKGIQTSSESISVAAGEIAQGNADLSQRTEEQAASLEETATSMEELTSTVRHNSDNARQATTVAGSASEIAWRGGEVVGRVVATMHGISASSAKMAEIIGVIEGIAFQTNILALNAAVEAARAGEQGRGFAVVAGEVRALAQRSASAAKEIKDLISESVNRVDAGSKLVEEAGNTITEIVESVKRVTDIVGEISSASEEQSTGIEQVNTAVSQMDLVTQQNAALVEQAAAATQSMAKQTDELRQAVAIFKIASMVPSASPLVAPRGRSRLPAPATRSPAHAKSIPIQTTEVMTADRAGEVAAHVGKADWHTF